ncbi:hypothetical protein HXP44_29470 [Streptomyces sioyaensis]|nr:hypothetical protein [Streptomyces sioyaensis]
MDSDRTRISPHIHLQGPLRRIARARRRGTGFLPLLDLDDPLLDALQLQVDLYRPESATWHIVAMTSSPSVVDLRAEPVDEVLDRVERSLDVRLERGSVVRKRRSVGARTDRGTWVRLERRPLARVDGQGWNGMEAAAALEGAAVPRWLAGVAWRDASGEAM